MSWITLLYTGAIQGIGAGALALLGTFIKTERTVRKAWPWFALVATMVLAVLLGGYVLWWVARVALALGIRWAPLVELYRWTDDAMQTIRDTVGLE